ncbi:hypothetical protein H4R34_002616 [Dimargaris verticillata]|uniref:THUMP domain-containing protein n=1 Tax=Dimargaris verticillata TaxID=2761393 RepID=A0A9W8B1H3_9FUNG|nr:hypothetical protein H4R34_002616 [Dimargaris verticillata]
MPTKRGPEVADANDRKKAHRKKQRKYIVVNGQSALSPGAAGAGRDGPAVVSHVTGFAIEPNQAGILVTCTRGKEAKCAREMYPILESYVEKLYPDVWRERVAAGEDGDTDNTGVAPTLDDQIAAELASLKRPASQRLFTNLRTLTDCIVFLKTPASIDPHRIVMALMQDLADSKQSITRHTNRVIPVARTCHANMADISKLAKELVEPIFNAPAVAPAKFAILPKIRNNQKIERMELIKGVAETIGPKHSVNLDAPDYCILVEILKSICFFTVLQDYYKYKRFNIYSLAEVKPAQPKQVPANSDCPPTAAESPSLAAST